MILHACIAAAISVAVRRKLRLAKATAHLRQLFSIIFFELFLGSVELGESSLDIVVLQVRLDSVAQFFCGSFSVVGCLVVICGTEMSELAHYNSFVCDAPIIVASATRNLSQSPPSSKYSQA